jgi:hypothetical protein
MNSTQTKRRQSMGKIIPFPGVKLPGTNQSGANILVSVVPYFTAMEPERMKEVGVALRRHNRLTVRPAKGFANATWEISHVAGLFVANRIHVDRDLHLIEAKTAREPVSKLAELSENEHDEVRWMPSERNK